jgi:hypothetical protein
MNANRMEHEGHTTSMEKLRNAYKIFVGNHEKKTAQQTVRRLIFEEES